MCGYPPTVHVPRPTSHVPRPVPVHADPAGGVGSGHVGGNMDGKKHERILPARSNSKSKQPPLRGPGRGVSGHRLERTTVLRPCGVMCVRCAGRGTLRGADGPILHPEGGFLGEAFHNGGWGMYPTAIFGILMVGASIAYAIRPERRFVPLQISLGIMTLVGGSLGFVTGLIKSLNAIHEVKPDERWIWLV